MVKEFLLSNPYWGLVLSFGCFWFGVFIQQKTKKPALQPILICAILIISTLLIFDIPYDLFKEKNQVLAFLLPLTATVLALPLYRNRHYLKRNIVPLVLASVVGVIASTAVLAVCWKAMGIDDTIFISMLPKSATAAIAVDLSTSIGGIPSVTMLLVILAGNLGGIFGPQFLRACRIKSEKAIGLAMGCMSHALGTARSFHESQEAGTMASLAMVLGGVLTSLVSTVLVAFLIL